MTNQLDLLTHYPKAAGWKDATTSKDAAQAIEGQGRAAILRERVLAAYRTDLYTTADEMAHYLNESILAIRPRVSELYKQGLLRRTGAKHKSDGGGLSHIMACVRAE